MHRLVRLNLILVGIPPRCRSFGQVRTQQSLSIMQSQANHESTQLQAKGQRCSAENILGSGYLDLDVIRKMF